jgi:hypothetical protein
LFQRVQDQFGTHRACHPPTDDAAGEHVDDKRDVDEAGPRRDIREIGHPELIRAARLELPIDTVERSLGVVIAERCPALAATNDAVKPKVIHQPLDRTASHHMPLAAELPPNLARTIDIKVLRVHAPDLIRHLRIAPQPWRQPLRIHCPCLGFVVQRWGDR